MALIEKNDNKYHSVEGVAMMILTMGEEAASKVLQGCTHDEIKKIMHAMSSMSDIKATDAHTCLTEFFHSFKNHSGILGGTKKYISNILNKTLEGNLAKDLVVEIYGDELRSEAANLAWIPADILSVTLKDEHISMQALIIAHLPVDYAASVLEYYSDEEANELIYQISQIEILTSSIVESVREMVLRCQDIYRANSLRNLQGSDIVANIITRYKGDKQSLFSYMNDKNEGALLAIEDSMFDFDIIFTQSQSTIERINEVVDIGLWAIALKGASEDSRNYIFNTLTSRMANNLKDDMASLGAIPQSRVMQARNEVIDFVKKLHKDGEINLDFTNEASLI